MDERHKKVIELYENLTPTSEIARILGYKTPTIYWILHKYGVELNPKALKQYTLKEVSFSVDPMWAAEFRGLFYGEGSVGLWKCPRHTRKKEIYHVLVPVLSMHFRDDDAKILTDIHEKLGGTLSGGKRYGPTNPSKRWSISGWPRVYAIIRDILLDGLIPAKKRIELQLLHDAILARSKMAFIPTKEQKAILEDYAERIKLAKCYQGSSD